MFTRILSILVLASAVLTPAHARIGEFLCDQNFSLKIELNNIGGLVGDHPVSLNFTYKNEKGELSYFNGEEIQKITIDKTSCQQWEQKWGHHLTQSLFENQHRKNTDLECRYLSDVVLKTKSETKKQNLCIGNFLKDDASYSFQKFYDGTVNWLEVRRGIASRRSEK